MLCRHNTGKQELRAAFEAEQNPPRNLTDIVAKNQDLAVQLISGNAQLLQKIFDANPDAVAAAFAANEAKAAAEAMILERAALADEAAAEAAYQLLRSSQMDTSQNMS